MASYSSSPDGPTPPPSFPVLCAAVSAALTSVDHSDDPFSYFPHPLVLLICDYARHRPYFILSQECALCFHNDASLMAEFRSRCHTPHSDLCANQVQAQQLLEKESDIPTYREAQGTLDAPVVSTEDVRAGARALRSEQAHCFVVQAEEIVYPVQWTESNAALHLPLYVLRRASQVSLLRFSEVEDLRAFLVKARRWDRQHRERWRRGNGTWSLVREEDDQPRAGESVARHTLFLLHQALHLRQVDSTVRLAWVGHCAERVDLTAEQQEAERVEVERRVQLGRAIERDTDATHRLCADLNAAISILRSHAHAGPLPPPPPSLLRSIIQWQATVERETGDGDLTGPNRMSVLTASQSRRLRWLETSVVPLVQLRAAYREEPWGAIERHAEGSGGLWEEVLETVERLRQAVRLLLTV